MATIQNVTAREILDSNGRPTIEASVILDDGATGTASTASSMYPAKHEAVQIHDKDEKRYKGLGVLSVINIIEKVIKPQLTTLMDINQQVVDRTLIHLDGTLNKEKLGANATIAVSAAYAKAQATSNKQPLYAYIRQYISSSNLALRIPTPAYNLINGGRYANSNLDFQEFLIIPASNKTFSDSLQMALNVYSNIRDILIRENLSILIGEDGGFGPSVATNEDVLVILQQAIEAASLRLGYDVFTGIDASANTFFVNQQYKIKDLSGTQTAQNLITFYDEIAKKYHTILIEDPFHDEDWDEYTDLNKRLKEAATITGDDLTATNPYRLQTAISKNSISGITIKPSQIGTVIETLAVVELARHAGLKIIVSDRSGETNDDFIADFSVAVNADYIKFGAPIKGERVAKYNRLLQIEAELKNQPTESQQPVTPPADSPTTA